MVKRLIIPVLLILCRLTGFAEETPASKAPDVNAGFQGCIISLPEDRECFKNEVIYFEPGSASLKAQAKENLTRVFKYMKRNPSKALRVDGHTDDRGSMRHNRRLGESRALIVRKELIRMGITPDRIDTCSYGEDRPAVIGRDKTALERNRRVEFVILIAPHEAKEESQESGSGALK